MKAPGDQSTTSTGWVGWNTETSTAPSPMTRHPMRPSTESFRLLHRLEPGPENTSWELWLRAERGTIEDFGSFEELRADGQVESFEGV